MSNILPYLIPAIVVIGWAVGIVQGNKNEDGSTPPAIYDIVLIAYEVSFVAWIVATLAKVNWLLAPSNLTLAVSSIPLAVHFYNKRDKTGTIIFIVVILFNFVNFIGNI